MKIVLFFPRSLVFGMKTQKFWWSYFFSKWSYSFQKRLFTSHQWSYAFNHDRILGQDRERSYTWARSFNLMIVRFTTQAYRNSNRNIQQSNSNPKQNPRYIHFWQIADSLDMFQKRGSSSLLACIDLLLSMRGCQGKHIRCYRVYMLELLGPRGGYPIPSMVGGKDHQILRHGSNSICPCIPLRQR